MKHGKRLSCAAISLLVAALVSGCDVGSSGGSSPGVFACPLLGASDKITIRLQSAEPLPANLAGAIEGEDIAADECESKGLQGTAERLGANRVDLTFWLTPGDPVRTKFFDPSTSDPIPNVPVNLEIFSRSACGEFPQKIAEISVSGLKWKELMSSPECSLGAYSTEVNATIEP